MTKLLKLIKLELKARNKFYLAIVLVNSTASQSDTSVISSVRR